MNKEDVGKLIFEKNINFKKIIKFQKNDKFWEILLKKQIIRVILKNSLINRFYEKIDKILKKMIKFLKIDKILKKLNPLNVPKIAHFEPKKRLKMFPK